MGIDDEFGNEVKRNSFLFLAMHWCVVSNLILEVHLEVLLCKLCILSLYEKLENWVYLESWVSIGNTLNMKVVEIAEI